MEDRDEIKLKSVGKAFSVLECFIDKPALGVTEISEKLGLYKSNVHSILTTLKTLGYLEQDHDTGRYRIGIKIFELSRTIGDRYSIKNIAMPYLQELSNLTKESVYLGVAYEDSVLYLDAYHPGEDINMMRSILGERALMYCTGIGKAMMAYLPKDLVETYLSKELISYTEQTICDKEVLLRQLEDIRRNGYAIDNMEHEYGIKCVAVPLFGKKGTLEGAFSVSGPSLRFDEERILELSALMKKYAKRIQDYLA